MHAETVLMHETLFGYEHCSLLVYVFNAHLIELQGRFLRRFASICSMRRSLGICVPLLAFVCSSASHVVDKYM